VPPIPGAKPFQGALVGDVPSVYAALAAAKNAVGAVAKSQRNSIQNFNFRGIDAVVNAVAPAFNEHGIISVPRVISHVYETIEAGAKRTPMAHAILDVEYFFYGPLGDHVMARVLAEAMDSGDKAVAKAMSVAYRTALLQVLNLPTDEKDPDESIYERSAKPSQEEQSPRPVSGRARPDPALSARASQGVPKTAQELADTAWKAATPEAVRGHYATAGTQGWLKHEIAHPQTAEKMTVEAFLTVHGNDLKHSKSPGTATAGVPASKGGK
jgi:ERF superfamily